MTFQLNVCFFFSSRFALVARSSRLLGIGREGSVYASREEETYKYKYNQPPDGMQ